VVVDVRLALVVLFLVRAIVVMAVRQLRVVVVVRVPVGSVVPFAQDLASVVMRDVIVIVGMGYGRVRVLWLLAFALRVLRFVR
jgi:hypothetical protein